MILSVASYHNSACFSTDGVTFLVESSLHLLAAVGWFNPLPIIILEHAFPLTGFAVDWSRLHVTQRLTYKKNLYFE